MATHHGGMAQPFDRDIDKMREAHENADTDIKNTQDLHPVEPDHFNNLQHNNPVK